MINGYFKSLICLICSFTIALTGCASSKGAHIGETVNPADGSPKPHGLFELFEDEAGAEDFLVILANPDIEDYEGLSQVTESLDFEDLGDMATDTLYLIPMKDKLDISIEKQYFIDDMSLTAQYETLGKINASLGEHYALDLAILNPNQSVRLVVKHGEEFAAHEFIRSDIGDKNVLFLSPESSITPIGYWEYADVFSGNAAMLRQENPYDDDIMELIFDIPHTYWWLILRIFMETKDIGDYDIFIPRDSYDYISSAMFSDHDAAELMYGLTKDGDGNLSYHKDEYHLDLFYYDWKYVLGGNLGKTGYVISQVYTDDYEFTPVFYRVDWEANLPFNPNINLPYKLSKINKMHPIELRDSTKEDYLWEYFTPILKLGLEFQNYSSPQSLDIEKLLYAYELYEFNYQLDSEDSIEREGEKVFVPRGEVESHIYNHLKVPANRLRQSHRYNLKEEAYEMEIMTGLGGYFPAELRGAWEYGNTILLNIEYIDLDCNAWFLIEKDEKGGSNLYLAARIIDQF